MIKIKPLALSIAVINSGASMAVLAQDTTQSKSGEVIEEVVVEGIRGSLKASMDIKRDSFGVVDAISAEDIGKFPDTNLAESLQRITGVSIDRQNNEGNQITVRGLGPNFNMVTLNGRQMPVASSPELESVSSGTQSRAFNFAEIASESVSGVQVFKTARADAPTGGMGATVNVETARPFDYEDTTIVASIAGIHDTSAEEGDSVTPEIFGMFATQFADGRVGLLANISYSERHFSEVSTHTDGWSRDTPKPLPTVNDGAYEGWCNDASSQCGDAPYVYRPATNISEIQHNERRRTNAQFVGQFAPTDNLTITADYVLSRFERDQSRYQSGLFGVVSPGSVENTRLDSNYTVVSATRTGVAVDALVYENELVIENDSFGINLDWQVNDTLNLTFDAHSSKAQSQPGGELNDNLQILQGPLGNNVDLAYSSSGITATVDDAGAFRDGAPGPVTSFQDIDGYSPLGSVLRNISIENTVDQFQFAANWDFDTVTLTGGLSYIDYEVKTDAISTGFVFQGLGACTGCSSALDVTSIDAPSGFNSVVEFDIDSVLRSAFPTQISSILAGQSPERFIAQEESLAAYFNLTSDLEIGELPGRLSVGLRYEETDVSGTGFVTPPSVLAIVSPTEGEFRVVAGTPEEKVDVDSDYKMFLPSLDFQVSPTEDTVARLSYGKTIARPDLNALRPTTSISDYRPGNSAAARGNPDVKPYSADNFDLAFEWYYAEGSYASVTFFYKEVDDYISTVVEQGPVLDPDGNPLLDPQGRFVDDADPSTPDPEVVSQAGDPEAVFNISSLQNATERSIDGWEFAIQHIFGETGFGMQANYTIVSSDAEYDSDNFSEQSILLGLSDSYNLVGFYEDELFSVRLAANWRDEFLFAENQLRFSNEPVFYDEYLQVDLSASYNISENFNLFFEALNITGEDQKQTGRYSNHFLFENDQEPRYTLGLRADF